MIKNFKRSDIQNTPFVATKPWVLSSFHNEDVLILEQSASIDGGIPLALEFIDYGGGDVPPFVNTTCALALEQQTDNKVLYEEGENIIGVFYPNSDPVNPTGTYKRLVYRQIRNAFYNSYQNPTKMFGLENIDFQLSGIKKFLTDRFRLFSITRDFFGEKMLENSIMLVDNSLDDNFVITDDGQGNILAGENLFSRVQEVRKFGNSVVVSGASDRVCPAVETTTTTPTTTTTTTTLTTSTTTHPPVTSSTTTKPGTSSTTPTTTPTTTTTTTTTPTTTTTTTTPAPTSTTTTTPTTTTTTTTTHTTLPPVSSTTTNTTTLTTSTTPTTTTTSTTTNAPPCQLDYDCFFFSADSIETVHWKPFNPDCGCQCDNSHCDKQGVCNSIFGIGVFGPYGDDRDGNGRLLTVSVRSLDAPADCQEVCTCGTEGCPDAPVDPAVNCCGVGRGAGKPSAWTACWKPVLDALVLRGCLTYDTNTTPAVCSTDEFDVTTCCDVDTNVTITWLF